MKPPKTHSDKQVHRYSDCGTYQYQTSLGSLNGFGNLRIFILNVMALPHVCPGVYTGNHILTTCYVTDEHKQLKPVG